MRQVQPGAQSRTAVVFFFLSYHQITLLSSEINIVSIKEMNKVLEQGNNQPKTFRTWLELLIRTTPTRSLEEHQMMRTGSEPFQQLCDRDKNLLWSAPHLVGRTVGVFLQVFLQEARSVEAPAAQRTGVAFPTRVELGVVPEGRAGGEGLLAEGAGELFLLSVSVLVVREPAPGGKAFGAQRTTERLLPSVSPLVLHQVAPLDEAPPTEGAGVGLLRGVEDQVPPQAASLGVADPAVRAGVRLLPGVDPLVDVHVDLLGEALPTDGAAVRLEAGVGGHVVRQPGRAGESSAAQRAEVTAF